jgi:hypothetical protein
MAEHDIKIHMGRGNKPKVRVKNKFSKRRTHKSYCKLHTSAVFNVV